MTVDADTLLERRAVSRIIGRISQSGAGCVAGNLLTKEGRSLIEKMQIYDYLISIAAIKRFQGSYGSTLVAQGAFSAYDTQAVREAGGWEQCAGEDIVLTYRLLAQGRLSLYEPGAIGYTSVPDTLRGLCCQRMRWARGMFDGLRAVRPWQQKSFFAGYFESLNLSIYCLGCHLYFRILGWRAASLHGHELVCGMDDAVDAPGAADYGGKRLCFPAKTGGRGHSPQRHGSPVLSAAVPDHSVFLLPGWLRSGSTEKALKLEKEGFQTVSLSEVIDFVQQGTALPLNPVLLVFDDGYRSVISRVLPLLEKYDAKALVSVIGARAQGVADGCDTSQEYMDWKELAEAVTGRRIELQSHSAQLHVYRSRKGLQRLADETQEAYIRMLVADVRLMDRWACKAGVPVLKAFAYPYGFAEPLADAVLRGQGYEATMTSEPHVNRLSRDPNCLYRMGRFNRSGLVDTETVIGWLTE